MTDKYAVIGNPIGHSLSPQIHQQFALQTGEDIEYIKLEAEASRFATTLFRFWSEGGKGCNVTLPFKEEAAQLSELKAPEVRWSSAANTVILNSDGRIILHNTDGKGLVRDIHENLKYVLQGKRILIIGAGGAARGVIPALLNQAPAQLTVTNRTYARALELVSVMKNTDMPHANSIEAKVLDENLNGFDLVINATSASTLNQPFVIPEAVFKNTQLVYDMAYGQKAQAFLHASVASGAKQFSDGLGMLVEQAAEAFFIWRGVHPKSTTRVISDLRVSLK